jgi:diguanylate cyclase (GGDEF)-like protein/PAS domain S-box-containing protein
METSRAFTKILASPDEALQRRLLVMTLTRKDGENASRVLLGTGIDCLVCADARQMMEELARGAGGLLLAEEVLVGETLQCLSDAVSAQPKWSDLPILVLTFNGADSPLVHRLLQQLGNIQLLERPVRVATLVTIARSALRSRERQYEMGAAQKRLQESEERFRIVADMAPFPLIIHAEDGEVLKVNRSWSDLSGYELADIPRMHDLLARAFGEHQAEARAEIEKLYAIAERRQGCEYTILCKDGQEQRIWQFSSAPLGQLSDGRRAVISMAVDVTAHKEAEQELKLAAMVYQDSSEAMLMTDEKNRIISVNAAFERITGYPSTEAVGLDPNFLASARSNQVDYREMLDYLEKHRYWKGELWLRKKNGQDFAAAITINTTFAPEGSVNRHVALFSDITKKREADELIWQQANFDTLTGLPNRSMFQDHLKRELRKASRSGQPLALMLLDLDGFKHVNDTLGHDRGDLLLRSAAQRLRQCVRSVNVVARLGGDEFTVVLSELDSINGAERVARNLLEVLSEPYHLGHEVVHVSASIGITLFPQDAASIEDLIKNADQAMYAAKQEGRNRHRYFTPSMQEIAQTRMRTINDLRIALEREQFLVRYQPIVELSTGRIKKAEALIRWQHPTRGLTEPDEFIATAEDCGMVAEFGDWVFREAARQAARWRRQFDAAFQVSVNISPVQFRSGGINFNAWVEHLRELDLHGGGIVAEITEGLFLDAGASSREAFAALRQAGIEVALDDFGTGFSALSYLRKFAIDYIKIDREFVENVSVSSDDLALCEAIIVMAHKLNIKVVAEGIESEEQRRLLVDAGCDYGQGYRFSKPVSAARFEEMLKADLLASKEVVRAVGHRA